jgi:uncharacterized membrane protein
MVPLLVLLATFALLLVLGRVGVGLFRDWVMALRWALALMFLFTASAHFGPQRPDIVRMVPPALPAPELLVTITGLLEIAGAVGLLVPRFAPLAAVGLALLLLALFPANVYAARHELSIGGRPVTPLVSRAALQLIFVLALLLAGFARGRWRRTAYPRS